jgi:hypothetical protein
LSIIYPDDWRLSRISLSEMPKTLTARLDEETQRGDYLGEVQVEWRGYTKISDDAYLFEGIVTNTNGASFGDGVSPEIEAVVRKMPDEGEENSDTSAGSENKSTIKSSPQPSKTPNPSPSASPKKADETKENTQSVVDANTQNPLRDIDSVIFSAGDLVLTGIDTSGAKFDLTLDTPIIYNDRKDRLMFPVRFFAEALGYNVEWQPETETIVLTDDKTRLILQIGSTDMIKNGKTIEMDVAPIICNGRTYLPIRYIGEGFGYTVVWHADTQQGGLVKSKV